MVYMNSFFICFRLHAESWDVIATCFFIDTAKNIVEYLETIYNALKFGGTWINIGTSVKLCLNLRVS